MTIVSAGITSSVPDADLVAVCRTLLGREPAAASRVGAGRNSRVFHVTLSSDGSLADSDHVVVKFYRHDPGDTRDRLATEFGALTFLWSNGVRTIPRALAEDRERYCAIYSYVKGDTPQADAITADDIDALVRFLADLQPLRALPESRQLQAASEASFSLADVVAHVEGRADRLRQAAAGHDVLRVWMEGMFDPLLREVREWLPAAAAAAHVSVDGELPMAARTLSPSDFGFHNTIRCADGSLVFVDFEYFGWDDPAKTLVDLLLHPGMDLSDSLKGRFADGLLAALIRIPGLVERARIVYPFFGLKWCLILLNDFLPNRATNASEEVRMGQLRKAEALARRIHLQYRHNPFLA